MIAGKTTSITGVPGISTWRSVYLTVVGIFIFWIILLAALPRLFS